MDRVIVSSKLLVIIVVVSSLNFYLVKCDYMNRKSKQFVPVFDSPILAKSGDYDVYDSSEFESSQMNVQEYLNKMNLLEHILNQIYLKPDLDKSIYKRGFGRSLGKDDRRRPGWELAYGKRKRSIN